MHQIADPGGITAMPEWNVTRRDASRLIGFGGFGWVWSAVGAAAEPQPPRPATAEALQRILQRIRRDHGLPGLAAGVVRGGKVLASGVTGVRRHGAADEIEPDDRFHLASCTKSMTATLAGVAVRKGKLGWTTTLADGLPALAERVRRE